jgi:hypothetical protein
VTAEGLHRPDRPSWLCGHCGQDWPCSPARVELGEQYAGDRVGLSVYMAAQHGQAAGEISATVPPGELYERFLAWTRPRKQTSGGRMTAG